MANKKTIGETEKTVLVGALVLGLWMGIDAIAKRAEARDRGRAAGDDQSSRAAGSRRVRIVRSRRQRREAA